MFHAGTALHGDRLVTNGGRILGVTGLGETIAGARTAAYAAVPHRVRGLRHRSDIALAAAGGLTLERRDLEPDSAVAWGHPAPPPTSSLTPN